MIESAPASAPDNEPPFESLLDRPVSVVAIRDAAVRFGPWFFLGLASVMAAIALREWWLELGITSIALALGVLAMREGRRGKRKALQIGGWIIALISLAVGSPDLAQYVLLGVGRISPTGWPEALVRMAEALHVEAGDVYAQFQGGILDRTYAWSIPVDNGNPDAALLSIMGPIDARDVPPSFPKLFPIWWRPDVHGDVTFFSTPDFPFSVHGSHGDHLLAMYDRSSRRLYVWLKHNGW